MSTHRISAGPTPAAFHASFLAACSIGGIRVALAPDLGAGEADFRRATAALKHKLEDVATLEGRLAEVEQKAARRISGGAGPLEVKSWGQRFVEADEYKSAGDSGGRGIPRVGTMVATSELEHKNLTSVAGSGGGLIPADRRVENPALLPWARLTIRDLVAPGTTEAGAVVYPRMVTRTNNAAPVAEGALKPQSDMTFEEVTAVVRTLAHFFYVSRQVFDDAPALAATIDREARAGLADVEDGQLLFGDGTGQNLMGLVPQAAPFVKQWNVGIATPLDVLIQAIAQVEGQSYGVDGLVLNAIDWRMLQSIRDTTGRYVGNSPFEASIAQRIWNTPTVSTTKLPRGKFLLGAFRTQAQIFDRLGIEVIASSEDRDNFIRNMITVRAEERLAFTVSRPNAFVYGDLNTSLAAS